MKYYKVTWLGATYDVKLFQLHLYAVKNNFVQQNISYRINGEVLKNQSKNRSWDGYSWITNYDWKVEKITKEEFFIHCI